MLHQPQKETVLISTPHPVPSLLLQRGQLAVPILNQHLRKQVLEPLAKTEGFAFEAGATFPSLSTQLTVWPTSRGPTSSISTSLGLPYRLSSEDSVERPGNFMGRQRS